MTKEENKTVKSWGEGIKKAKSMWGITNKQCQSRGEWSNIWKLDNSYRCYKLIYIGRHIAIQSTRNLCTQVMSLQKVDVSNCKYYQMLNSSTKCYSGFNATQLGKESFPTQQINVAMHAG